MNDSHFLRFPVWWLALIAAGIAFGIAVHHSGRTAFWLDEALSVGISGGAQFGPVSLDVVVERVAFDRAWPPLSNVLLWAWGSLTGWTEIGGRYLSSLLGLLSVAVMYQVGRELALAARLSMRFVPLACALVLVGSSFYLYYWQEMRGYTLALCMAAVVLWLYLRLLRVPHRPLFLYAAFTLGVAGVFYTHYIFSALPAAMGAWHYLTQRRHAAYRPILLCFALAVLLLTPWMLFLNAAIITEISRDRELPLSIMIPDTLRAFGNNSVPLLLLGVLPALALVKVRVVRSMLAVFTLVCAMIGFYYVLSGFFFHVRHVMVVMTLTVPWIGTGLGVLHRRAPVAGAAALALWVGAGFAQSVTFSFMETLASAQPRLPLSVMETAISASERQNPALLVFYSVAPYAEMFEQVVLLYYLQASPQPYAYMNSMTDIRYDGVSVEDISPEAYEERMTALLGGHEFVYYFRRDNLPTTPQETMFLSWMESRFASVQTRALEGFTIRYYQNPIIQPSE